ncbi:MAG: zinc-binding dehydrogenase [Acidimicrobiales bacterium]|nr:zinc-binding dehydrogenase [Acidimicrobiales bacterium]
MEKELVYMSKGKRLTSTVTSDSTVHLRVEEFEVPSPGPDEVLVAVEASPINPSDLGLLLAGADASTVSKSEIGLVLSLPDGAIDALAGRLDQAMPVGNEGAGVVIDAGDGEEAQALQGQVVAALAGGMYATHRIVKARDCLVLEQGTKAVDAASCFVNPLTALGMTETMGLEGHSALIHTAAASNLGQMLNRICIDDGIALVNIVRREEHVELLKSQGATHVVDSSSPDFRSDLVDAITTTGATVGFDAVGGGDLTTELLHAMEVAASSSGDEYSRYGSTTHKQLYIYGGLDRGPTLLRRNYGMAWGVAGWLLPNFLAKIGPEKSKQLRSRVAAELTTTFASSYSQTLSLESVLDTDSMSEYVQMSTQGKSLVCPQL